jgi:hypothetical protein
MLGLLCAQSCRPDAGGREGALAELERLAFVPKGETALVGRDGMPVVAENSVALLVDRFEVTRGEWLRHPPSADAAPDPWFEQVTNGWSEDTHALPASGMTLEEARQFARSRGMRLLSAREWLRIAIGARPQAWPWGQSLVRSVANTAELGLGRPVAVGTFEHGRTTLGTYDMLGNVWEWVEEPIAPSPMRESDLLPEAWALGGSYTTRLRRLYEFDPSGRVVVLSLDLDPRARNLDVGLRCAVDASDYLRTHASSWGEDDDAHKRLSAVGKRFGRDAIPSLEQLCAQPGAPKPLVWLLEGARGE